MKRFSTFSLAEDGVPEEPVRHGFFAVAILPDDTAQSLRAEYVSLMVALLTVWLGFVVIACSGYILAEWLRSVGIVFGLGKPVLLWLPVATVALTGPVWLPVAAWIERRDLARRLEMVAQREARRLRVMGAG